MKPMVRHLLIFAPLASAMSAPAFAQVAPTHSGSSSLKTFGSDEAWSVLSEFGACYASRSPASAIALVSTRAGSLEEAQLYRRLFHADNQSCLSLTSELRIPFQIVRGAERFLRRAAGGTDSLVNLVDVARDIV